jgi:hypothetical protein
MAHFSPRILHALDIWLCQLGVDQMCCVWFMWLHARVVCQAPPSTFQTAQLPCVCCFGICQ